MCPRFFFEIELLRSAPCPLPGGVRGVCCPHILVLRFQLQLNCNLWMVEMLASQGARSRRGSMARRMSKQHHMPPKTPKCGYSQYQVHQQRKNTISIQSYMSVHGISSAFIWDDQISVLRQIPHLMGLHYRASDIRTASNIAKKNIIARQRLQVISALRPQSTW